jgi:serine phosphatase RsbU (regulator of sigma subunit)/anti-sigma regulatory factor (Ser/Thr protein kinase)
MGRKTKDDFVRMKNLVENFTPVTARQSLRIEAACEFSGVRAATQRACAWLAERGLPETEIGAWELALVEAANNAVEHVRPDEKNLSIVIEISCGERDIEARITDHTTGFDWPSQIELPDHEAEGGRGLYLIKSLTDHAVYYRDNTENLLVLRRALPPDCKIIFVESGEAQNRLTEAETALVEMTTELASSYESLVALFRYSAELGAHTDRKDFSQRLLRDLMPLAEADCAVLRLLADDGKNLETLLVLPENATAPEEKIALVAENFSSVEIRAAQKRQDVWFDAKEPLAPNDPLRGVMRAGHGICHAFFVADQLVGTIALGRLTTEKPFTAAQINLLHTFIDFLAIQIVNARLLDERTVARVTSRELEIASEIQHSLLPMELPACPPFALAASCKNALQVGGDFYDAIAADDGAALLVIADVMGKGVPAALFAAVLRSTIRSMPQLFAQPGELLTTVNRTLFSDFSRVNMFATAKLVYLNPQRREIISTRAGHCPLIVYPPQETKMTARREAGLPLGIEPATIYSQTSMTLSPGAAVLLYTDGISESRNAAGEMLGEKKLAEILAAAATETRTAITAKQFLLEQFAAHRGSSPLTDDQTFILIRHQP